VGTSRRLNAAIGPWSNIAALAELGTFSHVCINGFGTCVGAFHLLEGPQHPVGTEGVCGHLQERKCCSRTCSAIAVLAKLGTFCHICVNAFGTCVGAFHILEVLQHPLGTEGMCGHLQKMKCCCRTLFCHCRTCRSRHLFLIYASMVLELVLEHFTSWRWHSNPSVLRGCVGTSRR
jgi:hypothetical protein